MVKEEEDEDGESIDKAQRQKMMLRWRISRLVYGICIDRTRMTP